MSLSSTYASACVPVRHPSLSLDDNCLLCNRCPTRRESSHFSSLLEGLLGLFAFSLSLRTDLTNMSASQQSQRPSYLRLSHFLPLFIHYHRLLLISVISAHFWLALDCTLAIRAQQFRLFLANEGAASVTEAAISFSWNSRSCQCRWQFRHWWSWTVSDTIAIGAFGCYGYRF